MTKWKCAGKEFDVEVALNGGCVTVVFLPGCLLEAAAPHQLSSLTDAPICVFTRGRGKKSRKNILFFLHYFLSSIIAP